MRQKSIEIEGHGHNAPLPMACRIGSILATSGVSGKNVKTGEMPNDPDEQTKHAFINMASVLKAGGLDMGDVVKMTVLVADEDFSASINKYWTQSYPDKTKRPARHTLVVPLKGGSRIRLEALAVAKDG